VIDISYVNKQLQEHIPDFKVCMNDNQLTSSIDIQYSILDKIEEKDNLYLQIKKIGEQYNPHIKVDKNGNLLEIYPSIDKDWSFKKFMPNIKDKVNSFTCYKNHIPYASFNLIDKKIEHIYFLKDIIYFNDIELSIIYRTKNSNLDRIYYKIEKEDFDKLHKFTYLPIRHTIDFIKNSKADYVIFYLDYPDNFKPHAMMLSWSIFNDNYDTICCERIYYSDYN